MPESVLPEISEQDTESKNILVLSEPNDGGHIYRLYEIARVKKNLTLERDQRALLFKKYKRGVSAMDGTNTALIAASTGMGISGAAILSTIVAIPITVGLEIGAVVCAVGGVISNFISKRLSVKARKHDSIRVLCMSKLNTISSLVMYLPHLLMVKFQMKSLK